MTEEPAGDQSAADEPAADHVVRAAWLYYEQELNQEEVARRLQVSRSTVSRLLAEARRAGVVEITVTQPLPDAARLAEELAGRFGLFFAAVEPASTADDRQRAAARAGARFLSGLAKEPGTVGVGWGTTLHMAAELVPRGAERSRTIVEIVGRPQGEGDMVAVSGLLARRWGIAPIPVPAPAFVRSARVASELRQDPVVRAALDRARGADVIVVGVGSTDRHASLIREGIVAEDEIAGLRNAGAAGDILGHFFDAAGRRLRRAQPLQVVGLSLAELAAHGRVVAVAGGPGKVAALGGALRGGLIQGVVTDQLTAEAVLDED